MHNSSITRLDGVLRAHPGIRRIRRIRRIQFFGCSVPDGVFVVACLARLIARVGLSKGGPRLIARVALRAIARVGL
jgi:hypothetical protein